MVSAMPEAQPVLPAQATTDAAGSAGSTTQPVLGEPGGQGSLRGASQPVDDHAPPWREADIEPAGGRRGDGRGGQLRHQCGELRTGAAAENGRHAEPGGGRTQWGRHPVGGRLDQFL